MKPKKILKSKKPKKKNKIVFGFGAIKGIGKFSRKDRAKDRF